MFQRHNKIYDITLRGPSEVLLENRLEKDIQRMLYPIHFMLKLFFSSKYNIRDDYITPKGRRHSVIATIAMFLYYALSIYRYFFTTIDDTMNISDNTILYLMYAFYFVFYNLAFTILFIQNILYNQINVSLILLIQSIHKNVDFSKEIETFTIWNWITVIGSFSINASLVILYYSSYNYFNAYDIAVEVFFITININLVCSIRVIILLRSYLEKWIYIVMTLNEGDVNDRYIVQLFEVYHNILEAYKIYKKVFPVMVLFHMIDVFARNLCFLSILLAEIQSPEGREDERKLFVVQSILTASWLMKDMLLVIIQCVQCEKFYIAVAETETACIMRLKNANYSDCEESLYQNVIQVNRTSFSKMTACGLFDIDATSPLHLIGLLTSYIIVMLQFTFL